MSKYYVIKVGNRGYISKYKNYNYNLQKPSQMCLTNKIENAKLFTGSLTFMLGEYKVVPITICEGDLEEKNRVLKKALELACDIIEKVNKISYEFMTPSQKIDYDIEGRKVKNADYFIQQAKESEKDEEV